MTTETKKAPDYTASAENLCNPPEVFELLNKLHEEQKHLELQQELLRSQNEELCKQIATTSQIIAELEKDIKQAVETYGSFQDIDLKLYAVKYRRMSKSYDVGQFKRLFKYEKYVPAVVIETINEKALQGLIKGGLINEEELKRDEVITETPSFAFYIR